MGKIKVSSCETDGMVIEGLHVIEPTVFNDERGYFMETYNQNDFKEAGLNMVFVQDNQSMSTKGVLRGLHFQKQYPQCKLVRVVRGTVFDVAVDFIAFTEEDVQRDVRLFAGRAAQYIFISSASAYQKPVAALPITESTPLANPYWQYSRDKIACENFLMERYREEGFPVTIVRPSHTYCGGKAVVALHGARGCWQTLARIRAGKPVIIPGDGTSLWTATHADDFAVGFVGLMGNPHALGTAVHITTDEGMTWNQIYAVLASAMGAPLCAAYVASKFLAVCGRAAGYDFEGPLLGDKAANVRFDNTKIKRLVPDFAPRVSMAQGIRGAVEYLLAHPELQTPDPEFDTWCDRVLAAQSAAKAVFDGAHAACVRGNISAESRKLFTRIRRIEQALCRCSCCHLG